jgi:hypothetical protein
MLQAGDHAVKSFLDVVNYSSMQYSRDNMFGLIGCERFVTTTMGGHVLPRG